MARAPEPDRTEFKGKIADHIMREWSALTKGQTRAITEAITGNRKEPRPFSVKLSGELSLNVGKDHIVRGFSGSGKRITDAEAIKRFDKVKGQWDR